jgi:Flp pilus assembly pilin Flp
VALQSYVNALHDRIARESGQTMAEYAVVLTVITTAVVAAVALLSTNIGALISSVASLVVGS